MGEYLLFRVVQHRNPRPISSCRLNNQQKIKKNIAIAVIAILNIIVFGSAVFSACPDFAKEVGFTLSKMDRGVLIGVTALSTSILFITGALYSVGSHE